MFEKSHKSRN